MGGETTTIARGGRFFAHQLDILVVIVTECRYFPEIPRLHHLPAYVGTLEIGQWFRDWRGITCSRLICNIKSLVTVCSGGHRLGL